MWNRAGLPVFRHEMKYYISQNERQAMIQRLKAVLPLDENGSEKGYTIRSLYFDDYWMSACEEKNAGTDSRKKFRIRIYDYGDKVIKLECKEKQGSYIHKEAASLTREETEWILSGNYGFLLKRAEAVCRRFYTECTMNLMHPAVIVDYEREAFVCKQGDVRITFDNDVRSAWMEYALFDSGLPAYAVLPPDQLIMEVKYTEFLPEWIRTVVSPDSAQMSAASKYTMCMEKKREMTR